MSVLVDGRLRALELCSRLGTRVLYAVRAGRLSRAKAMFAEAEAPEDRARRRGHVRIPLYHTVTTGRAMSAVHHPSTGIEIP